MIVRVPGKLCEGVDIQDLNVAWWRRQVGMVGQDPEIPNSKL